MNANARLHLRRLVTSGDGRPEVIRVWVAFFRRAMPMPPLPMIGILGVAFGLIGIVPWLDSPPFFDQMVAGGLRSGERQDLWRYVLVAGVGAGLFAMMPEAREPEAPLFRMLPWSRERHTTGVAMAAGAYALVIAAGVVVVAHDASVAFAAAGVMALVVVCVASVRDVLARARTAMVVLAAVGVFVVAPAPLSAFAESAPITTGIAGIAGALWMLGGAYAPSIRVRQKAGMLASAEVRQYLSAPIPGLLELPAQPDAPLPVVSRPGPPRTYAQWMVLRGGKPFTWTSLAVGVGVLGVFMPLLGYVMGTPQMFVCWVMLPFYQASDGALRLPPVSRRLRAQWGFLRAGKAGLRLLTVAFAGTAAFALWDPWPGVRDSTRPMSPAELQAFGIVAILWMLPARIWFTMWLPHSSDKSFLEALVNSWRHFGRFMAVCAGLGVALGLAGLLADAIERGAVGGWMLAASALALAIITNWICWRLVERRYLTKDLIK